MFRQTILNWYSLNKRELPWRHTQDPYLIWLSEVILQQTRVDQGMPYYYRFAEKYPAVNDLANASEDEVLKLWQGLGYYSRARNMHATAKQVVIKNGGKFPATYEELIKLKGVGAYTAAAIASFAFGLPYPVVDGNVYRVLSRYFGIETPIDSTQGKKEFYDLAISMLDQDAPGIYNQGIMEFGAIQCKPASPDCGNCPLGSTCFAYINKRVPDFPVKKKKVKTRDRFFNYLVIKEGSSVYLRKRDTSDIWANMYDFPLIESATRLTENELLAEPAWMEIIGKRDCFFKGISSEIKHVLSHQIIYAKFWEIEFNEAKFNQSATISCVQEADLVDYALPKLIENYLK